MQTLKSTHKLRCIEASTTLSKFSIFAQVSEEFASIAEVHDKVEFTGRLKRIVELDNEGTRDFFQNVTLSLSFD